MAYETILVETRGRVGLITLHRPQALNALNSTVVAELNTALDGFEADPGIGCVVITGSEKAFAAGADIKEMQSLSYPRTYLDDFITAEAERAGLVARVVPAADLLAEAMKAAETIASMSLPIAMMTKESVNRSYETSLAEGIRFERRVFQSMFAIADQREGMTAFVEKRKPNFSNS